MKSNLGLLQVLILLSKWVPTAECIQCFGLSGIWRLLYNSEHPRNLLMASSRIWAQGLLHDKTAIVTGQHLSYLGHPAAKPTGSPSICMQRT